MEVRAAGAKQRAVILTVRRIIKPVTAVVSLGLAMVLQRVKPVRVVAQVGRILGVVVVVAVVQPA
jgi:hypothetical protein